MTNLDVAVGSFWQLARHWKKGGKAKLELSCEDGNLHIQLSAVLGHPDQPHFPHPPSFRPPPPSSFPSHKKKKNIPPSCDARSGGGKKLLPKLKKLPSKLTSMKA